MRRLTGAGNLTGVAVYSIGSIVQKVKTENCEVATTKPHPTTKAEIFDAELHAIQEGLLFIAASDWTPGHLLICVDNQAALQTLAGGNPDSHEFAHHTLSAISNLQGRGWTMSGLWTPAHCGIPGNERADLLAKAGSQLPQECPHCTPAQPRPGFRPRPADSLRLIRKCSFLRTRPSRSHHLPPSRENSKALARYPPAHYSGCIRGRHHRTPSLTPSLTRRPKTASAVVPGQYNI